MKKWFEKKLLNNNKNTLLLVLFSSLFILSIYQIILLCKGTYFNSNSDDVVQYSPILLQYIENIKHGNLGFFNFYNGTGASIFADAYYVPIDIFSILTFLLSFIMDGSVAFSCVELMKVVLGVTAFAFFLQKCKYNNKIVLILSFMYFATGGAWAFATYPTYFSLFFYLPVSLIVVKWFVEGKRWILPIYGFVLVLYNFYNAYTLFIFMLFDYIVITIRDNYVNIKKLIKDAFVFGCHIILSVIMSMFILLPSVMYILKYTSRNNFEFSFFYDINVYLKMIYKVFVYESGVNNLQNGMMYTGTYANSQYSFYIGVLGLYILLMLFFLKDRVSKIYKWTLVSIVIMMMFPIFSMIFSGVGVAYTRWFSYIHIILLYFIGYVISQKEFNLLLDKRKKWLVLGLVAIYVLFIVNFIIQYMMVKNYLYLTLLINIFIFIVFFSLFLVFLISKQKSLLVASTIIEMVLAIIMNFSASWNTSNIKNNNYYKKVENIKDYVNIDGLERVYISNRLSHNLNRRQSFLTNESVFHSFNSKYIKEFEKLYGDKGRVLNVFIENRYDPNFSRIIDYKYVVVSKNDNRMQEYKLDFLKKQYENNDFIIYENENYNSFYVYENYYNENEVTSLEDLNILDLEKALFDGVILSDDNLNLNKIDFANANTASKVEILQDLNLVKNGNYYVSNFEEYKINFSGYLYIKGDNYENVKNIKIISDDKENKCLNKGTFYTCKFENSFDSIVFETNGDIDQNYKFVITKENEYKTVFTYIKLNEELKDKRINYYINYYLGKEVTFIDENDNILTCPYGYCNFENFTPAAMLIQTTPCLNVDGWELYYDVNDFNDNNDKLLASNKSLSYNKSTVNIKYHRVSESRSDQVIVLPITYSDEWKVYDSNYEVVKANGGFVGIVVKNGVKDIDVTIKFEPKGLKVGLIVSLTGIFMYCIYLGINIYVRRKKEMGNENI